MPIASILESNKPFVFTTSSHSNGSSTELASPSTKASLPRSVPHSASCHSSTTSSPREHGSYYYSSLSGDDYDNNSLHDNAYQQSPNRDRRHSHYQGQRAPRHDGHKYPTTKNAHEFNDIVYTSSTSTSTPATLNTRLPSPSPSTPTAAAVLSTTTTTTPPPQLPSVFPSKISATHLKDSSYSLSPTSSITNRGHPSSRHENGLGTEHQHVKTEETGVAPLRSNSYTTLTSSFPPPQSTMRGTTTTPSPLKATNITPTLLGNSTLTTTNSANRPVIGQVDEGESGYFDGSATENRRVKRRKELTQRIDGLNSDFSINKERFFTEKLLVVQNEVSQARNNTHTQFKEDLILLESMRQKTIEDGRLFRNYQTQVTDNQFTLEIHLAEEEYLVEQQEIREKLFAVLEEKRRKFKEDKDNCDLTYDVPMEAQTRMNKRNLRKRGMDNGDGKLNKRKQVSGPALVFRLKDEEVYEDLQAMRNGFVIPEKKSSANKKK